tara:strand:+ start:67 stop:549 length:483 start_codon:yes stop_codon:yes gene_type:complete
MKQFIPSLADKAALTLFYDSNECVDFSPYNEFATIIQKFYKPYILRVRACVYIQRTYRGFSWRKIIFNFRGTNIQYISMIVEKLRPEWPVGAWSSFIERRNSGMLISLSSCGVIPWREWVEFYDNWDTAFSHYLRPIFCRRRMNFHASLYNTQVLYRFAQ